VARRLARIHSLVEGTGHLARFIIFGSFITAKSEPNDVDIFLLMDDSFDVSKVTGKQPFCSTISPLRITKARASFGCGARELWAANRRPSKTGNSNATARAAALWR
jgi:hypothetical protein